jgi:hypothetical protein
MLTRRTCAHGAVERAPDVGWACLRITASVALSGSAVERLKCATRFDRKDRTEAILSPVVCGAVQRSAEVGQVTVKTALSVGDALKAVEDRFCTAGRHAEDRAVTRKRADPTQDGRPIRVWSSDSAPGHSTALVGQSASLPKRQNNNKLPRSTVAAKYGVRRPNSTRSFRLSS